MNQRNERDYRLDFCRGLALIVIFIDHVPHNPVAKWTLHNFAFCDAAEIFVLISGMASYLAYGSKLERWGFSGCVKAIGRRWLTIYLAHLVLFLAILGATMLASSHFSGTDYVDLFGLRWLLDHPRKASFAALTLRYLPMFLDILPLYLVLLGAAPLALYLVKRDYRLALLFSSLVYLTTWLTGFNLRAGNDGQSWCFNPFAWQLLYVVGMVLSHVSRTAPEKLQWRRRWLVAALIFIIFAFIAAAPWNGEGLALFDPPIHLWPAEKTFLAPLRILNVLALLYVFAFFVSAHARLFRSKLAAPLLSCGRHSLPIFGFGVILSALGYIASDAADGALQVYLVVDLAGVAMLLVFATALERYRNARVFNVSYASESSALAPRR